MNVPQYDKGKIMTDEQGKPIRLEVGKETAQEAGFPPEGPAEVSRKNIGSWRMFRLNLRKEIRSLFQATPGTDLEGKESSDPG